MATSWGESGNSLIKFVRLSRTYKFHSAVWFRIRASGFGSGRERIKDGVVDNSGRKRLS